MADFADDVALLSGNGCCRVDRIACAGVENRGKKRKSTKRCGLDRLNLIYAKRAVTGPINGPIRYPRLCRSGTCRPGAETVILYLKAEKVELRAGVRRSLNQKNSACKVRLSTEKLVNLFQGAKASLKKRAFFKEPVEPVNLLANLFAGSNVLSVGRGGA